MYDAVAEHAGHSIDLDAFQPEQFLNAMIASFKGDELPLTTIIEDLTIKDQ